ncbi:MAG: DUF3810 domain-containing protein [Hungatella sp.]|nr:DUF3810 domain-containing protein [Hungatella sp.]
MENTARNRQNKIIGAGGATLLALAAAGQLGARNIEGFARWYSVHIYSVIVAVVGRICGLVPVSVVEFGLYALGAASLWYVFGRRRGWFCIASRAVFLVGAAAFLYTFNCGINYYRPPFSSELDLDMRESSVEELKALCRYLTEKVNETVDDSLYEARWAVWGREAMMALGEEYAGLSGYYPRAKPVTISWILSVQQLSGIYSPFTVEGNYNRAMTAYNIPHTICHELSHLRGFMREDEANFIGYLACIGSDRRIFQYSGYLTGWVYAGNALARQDIDSYREIYGSLDPRAVEDLRDNSIFWNRYEGKVAQVSNQVNDTYLKINDQKEGVKTYGRMVDLMLAYHREEEE